MFFFRTSWELTFSTKIITIEENIRNVTLTLFHQTLFDFCHQAAFAFLIPVKYTSL